MIFNKKLDNILICGGYNHIGILLIEKILCEKMDYNIIIFDNLNNIMRYRNNNNIQQKYGYLEGDIVNFIHGDIRDYDCIEKVFNKYNIHYVINNIKYNPRIEYETNFQSLKKGCKNILNLCEKYNCSLLSIQREITHNSIYLNNKLDENIIYNSIDYINIQNEINSKATKEMKSRLQTIRYKDYTYDIYIDFSMDIVKKFVYMEKIGDNPYYIDINAFFVKTESIINKIFYYISYNSLIKPNIICHMQQTKMNIKKEIYPLIKNTFQKIQNIKNVNSSQEIDFIKYIEYVVNNYQL